jgi:hypothetical protein
MNTINSQSTDAAQPAGADVFLTPMKTEERLESRLDDVQRRAEIRLLLSDEVPRQTDGSSYRHWGINE